MSGGERAAENTKGFFKEASHATESLRQNINSFADDLIGSKSGNHANSADAATAQTVDHSSTSDTSAGSHAGTHNTGLTGGGTTTGSHTSSGIHPDAQRLGAKAEEALSSK